MLETINLDNGLTTAGQSLAPFGSLFTQSGVLRPNSFSVSALTSPGMFVEVSGSDDDDVAIIKTADGSTYFVRNTLNLQVPILANSSGVTKTDAIVLFVDPSAGDDENAGSPGAAQIIAVRRDGVGTGLPNDGEIDAGTSNNPWIFLKGVEVEHGAGEIEDEDLEGNADRAHISSDLLEELIVGTSQIADDAVSQSDSNITASNDIAAGSPQSIAATTGNWYDLTDMSKTLTTTGGNLLVNFFSLFSASVSTDFNVRLIVDGNFVGKTYDNISTVGKTYGGSWLVKNLEPGAHTIKLQARTHSNCTLNNFPQRSFTVVEFKK